MPEAGSRGVNQSGKLVLECHCEAGTIFKSNFEENFFELNQPARFQLSLVHSASISKVREGFLYCSCITSIIHI